MTDIDLCKCCLTRNYDKSLKECYKYLNKTEVYSEMLKYCFGIHILVEGKEKSCNGICEVCVGRLRDACEFKLQVQDCQEKIAKADVCEESKDIKLEVMLDDSDTFLLLPDMKHEPPDDGFSDSDEKPLKSETNAEDKDELLSEILRLDQRRLKKEKIGKRRTSDKTAKKKVSKNMKSLQNLKLPLKITRIKSSHALAKLISPLTLPSKENSTDEDYSGVTINHKKYVKRIKLKLNGAANSRSTDSSKYQETNLNSATDRSKYQENISNLVKHSNCTPFINRTIHGFTCVFCNDVCRTIQELRDHISSAHKKNENQLIKTKLNVERIRTLKVDITDLKCNLCDLRMDSIKNMKSHLTTHNINIYEDVVDYMIEFRFENDRDFNCIFCRINFETYFSLLKHMNTHYRNFICDVCDMGFINFERLNNHKKSHVNTENPCKFCGKIFDTPIKRLNHEKIHKPNRTTKCSHCDEKFPTYLKRNRHMKLVHNDIPGNYICNICDRKFLTSGELTTHRRKKHLMEKNHVCSECGKGFFAKQLLEKHMLKHTGERNFKCTYCGKAYGRKYTLTEHIRIHLNDRRFKCPICDAAFVQKCSMKSHMQSNHSISWAEYELSKKNDDASVS